MNGIFSEMSRRYEKESDCVAEYLTQLSRNDSAKYAIRGPTDYKFLYKNQQWKGFKKKNSTWLMLLRWP